MSSTIQPAPAAGSAPGRGSVADLIRSRRTIHEFRREGPPRDVILSALDTARWAPNHHLSEPWRFYLLGPQTVAQVVELNARLTERSQGAEAAAVKRERWSGIPGWLVVTCERSDDPVRAQEDYAACCCVIHNFQLCLWEQGIGVKWTSGAVTRDADFYDAIWVDRQAEQVVGMIWYGYPAEVPMTGRKEVEEVTTRLP